MAQLALLGGYAGVTGFVIWLMNRMSSANDRRIAEMATAWAEYQDVVADVLEDIARFRPEIAEMADLNRARLEVLRPAVEKLAARQPMTIREQVRVGREVRRLDARDTKKRGR